MKNKLKVKFYYNESHIWATVRRRKHLFGQTMLSLSQAQLALLFPKLNQVRTDRDYLLDVSLRMEVK